MQKYEKEKVVIEFPNKMVVLSVQPFDGDVDTEAIFRIDYANILGEIITFPVIFNKIANMKAEFGGLLAKAKFDLEVLEARKYKDIQSDMVAKGEKKPSIKDVEMAVLRDEVYQKHKHKYIELERNFNYLDSLYWSAQSKDTKLNKLTEKIKPEEFENEIMEGTYNGVLVKLTKKSIK